MQQAFHGETQYNKWSSTIWGRGKRKDVVTSGLYCVVHLGTGKFIIGRSKTVSKDVDQLIVRIKGQASHWPKMNRLMEGDPENTDLELLEFPASQAEAKQIEGRIRVTLRETQYSYLLLN